MRNFWQNLEIFGHILPPKLLQIWSKWFENFREVTSYLKFGKLANQNHILRVIKCEFFSQKGWYEWSTAQKWSFPLRISSVNVTGKFYFLYSAPCFHDTTRWAKRSKRYSKMSGTIHSCVVCWGFANSLGRFFGDRQSFKSNCLFLLALVICQKTLGNTI